MAAKNEGRGWLLSLVPDHPILCCGVASLRGLVGGLVDSMVLDFRRVHRCHLRTSAVLRDRRGEGEGGRRDKAEKMV